MGGGAQGGALECSSPYPANADTWAVYGPFSLVGATQAELTFYLYGNTQESANCSNDYLFVGAATDGKNFSGGRLCGPYQAGPDGRGFTGFRLNLADWLGQPRVWVAMAFESDGSVTEFGYMIDDIALSATFGADSRMVRLPILLQGVQHSQPTLTPTRTQTQPAATATPTASPTPSPRPTRILRYDEENAEIRRAPFPVVSPARVSIQALRFDEPVARELVAVQFVVLTEDGTAVDETVGIEVWQADSSGKAATRVHQQQETIRLAAGERAELTYSLTSGPKTVGPVFYVGMRTLSTNRPKPVMPGGIYKDSEVTPADFYRSYGRLGSNDPPTEKIPWGNLVIRAVVLE